MKVRRQIAFDATDESGDVLIIESDTKDGMIGFFATRQDGLALTPESARKAADFLVQVANELDPPKIITGSTINVGSIDPSKITTGTFKPGGYL